jgi:hypothetical protein
MRGEDKVMMKSRGGDQGIANRDGMLLSQFYRSLENLH